MAGQHALGACASNSRPIPVTHSQVFGGDFIAIHPPASTGWAKIQESQSGIAFGKGNRDTSESFIANVGIFGLEPAQTPEQYENLIRTAAKNDTDPKRFEVQHESISYTDERPYPCVRYQSVSIDKARVAKDRPLILELDGIYCRHPVQPESGFAVIFSHRGLERYPGLRSEAEQFIQNVQIPER